MQVSLAQNNPLASVAHSRSHHPRLTKNNLLFFTCYFVIVLSVPTVFQDVYAPELSETLQKTHSQFHTKIN